MGQAGSTSRNQGQCGAPYLVPPKEYALTKIHKIPKREKFLSMYAGYTVKMACEDIQSFKKTGRPVHTLAPYHKILSKGFLSDDHHDPREYVFEKIYKLTPREIENVRHENFYTADMAIKEIRHQHDRKVNPSLPKFKYEVGRGIRFTNTKHKFVYKKGRKGYAHGFKFSDHATRNYQVPDPHNPKVMRNIDLARKEAYAKGMANAHAKYYKHIVPSAPSAPHQFREFLRRDSFGGHPVPSAPLAPDGHPHVPTLHNRQSSPYSISNYKKHSPGHVALGMAAMKTAHHKPSDHAAALGVAAMTQALMLAAQKKHSQHAGMSPDVDPLSLEHFPTQYGIKLGTKLYNARQLAQMITHNTKLGRPLRIPHTRQPMTTHDIEKIMQIAGHK